MNAAETRATFTVMEESTGEDWARIGASFAAFARKLPDRVLAHLRLLDGDYGGFAVDRLQHSLQTATRAHRAAILRPFVSEANLWMVEKHGIFQGYYFFHHLGMDRNLREQFRGHPGFERTALFCERYDGPAFDPHGETLPLEFFEPMLRRLFQAPRQTRYAALAERA